MSKYVINGHEFDFDPLDLDVMERWQAESARLVELSAQAPAPEDRPIDILRRRCLGTLDFFDAVVGAGTSDAAFGQRVNARDIINAFRDFNRAVAEEIASVTADFRATEAKPVTLPTHTHTIGPVIHNVTPNRRV